MSSKYLILLLCFVMACKKGDEKTYSDIPEIEFISITPSSMTEGSQNVIISFSYKDGNGDLGENNTDSKNLFVTDNRLGITYSFRIRQLAPDGSSIPITGTLNADIGTVFITDNSASQNADFTLYIKDRAGNQSNTIATSPVTLQAQ